MKQQRRHELKTNDLSVYLQEIYQTIQRNSRYITGGIVVVAVILIIGLVVSRNRAAAEDAAWASYNDLLTKDVTEDPTVLPEARRLTDQYGDDERLGPAVLAMYGKKLYESALDMTGPEQQEERIKHLKEARSVYGELAGQYPTRAVFLARAKMMQALIEESLIVLGEGDEEVVRSLYKELKDSESGVYANEAEQRLANLDERLVPLKIVAAPATKPAEETPAPQESEPAPTSEEDATSPPETTTPAASEQGESSPAEEAPASTADEDASSPAEDSLPPTPVEEPPVTEEESPAAATQTAPAS
jgi:hypothetical protein